MIQQIFALLLGTFCACMFLAVFFGLVYYWLCIHEEEENHPWFVRLADWLIGEDLCLELTEPETTWNRQ